MPVIEKRTILVVDDTPENIDVLTGILRPHYKVKVALNGLTALKIAFSENKPLLILLDIMMPDMDGYEVCQRLKSNIDTANTPVIFITAKSDVKDEQKGLGMGAVDYITKPISPPILLARIKTHLALHDQSRHLESLVQQRTEELTNTRLEIIRRLGRAAEYKDNETGMHVIRMSLFCKFIAQDMGMDPDWCELLYNASPMHDIGKIGIPDAVLLKPGRLDADEWKIMQKHAEFGAEIIGKHSTPLLGMAEEIAICHHEKWDGSGYPKGLKEKEIPLCARIVAIADVFDALTSERPYKKAWPEEKALALLTEESGKHFDPELIPHFFNCLPKVREAQQQFKE